MQWQNVSRVFQNIVSKFGLKIEILQFRENVSLIAQQCRQNSFSIFGKIFVNVKLEN